MLFYFLDEEERNGHEDQALSNKKKKRRRIDSNELKSPDFDADVENESVGAVKKSNKSTAFQHYKERIPTVPMPKRNHKPKQRSKGKYTV